jgi:hypothetical protein
VNDEEYLLLGYKMQLDKVFEITTANNGLQAVEIVQ